VADLFPDGLLQLVPDPRTKLQATFPASRILIVDNDKYLTYLRWLAYAVTKGAKDAGQKIPAYFRQFWQSSQTGLQTSLQQQNLLPKMKTTDLAPDYFIKQANLPDVPKQHRGGQGAKDGVPVVQFPNGFKWISLNREACRAEGDAGGHCGNTADPHPGDNVLSLRDKENRVYLTFIVNDGEMGEMKANGNKKPDKSMHPYIVALLELPMVKSIGVARYLPENNFKITDLDYDNLVKLAEKRPDLVKIDRQEMTMIKHRNNMPKLVSRLEKKHPNLKPRGESVVTKPAPAAVTRYSLGSPSCWKTQRKVIAPTEVTGMIAAPCAAPGAAIVVVCLS
jgi:hypothetical protein